MIYIGKYPSILLKEKPNSLFIKFNYDPEMLARIKSLPCRKYVSTAKIWEIPLEDIDRLVDTVGLQNIQCYNEIPEFELYVSYITNPKQKLNPQELKQYYSTLQCEVEYPFKSTPMPHQIEAINMSLHNDKFFITDTMGLGKAQPLSCKVLTKDSWKYMNDIEVGDLVAGRDGEFHKVLKVFPQGVKQVYKVTFNDGTSTRCCKEHLWDVKTHYSAKWKTVDTEYLMSEINRVARVYIPMCNAVQFSKKEVQLHPYLLGALLGDGSISSGHCNISISDKELEFKINEILPTECNSKISKFNNRIDYAIRGNGKVNPVIRSLKSLGLYGLRSHEKFIPNDYLFNSVDVRLEVLRGLMDTDGYCSSSGVIQYYSTSERLKDGVKFIIESLGGQCREKKCRGRYKKGEDVVECKDYYLLTIKMPDEINPFYISSKANNVKLNKKYKPTRIIRSITPDGYEECKCILVDSEEHLYLTENFIVTHNTAESIYIMDYKISKGLVNSVLVICGVNKIKYNWHNKEIPQHSNYNSQIIDGTKQKRLEKLQNCRDYKYNIINVESIRSKEIVESIRLQIQTGVIDAVIIDEMHKMNNHKSQQGKNATSIVTPYMIGLSGTPITKHPELSWNILHWFGFEQASRYQFCSRYCKYIDGMFMGYQNLEELHKRFDRHQLRRTKDFLELPEKIYKTEYLELGSFSKEYNTIRNGILMELGEVTKIPNPAVITLRLRQFLEKVKIPEMIDDIKEITDNGGSVVVFSAFKDNLIEMNQKLRQCGISTYIAVGGLTDDEKVSEDIARFQSTNTPEVFLGTISMLGTGFTLTKATYVMFLTKSWTVVDNDQAEDRCHRLDTKSNVTIIDYVVQETIDERVNEVLAYDKQNIDLVVDGKKINFKSKDLLSYLLS